MPRTPFADLFALQSAKAELKEVLVNELENKRKRLETLNAEAEAEVEGLFPYLFCLALIFLIQKLKRQQCLRVNFGVRPSLMTMRQEAGGGAAEQTAQLLALEPWRACRRVMCSLICKPFTRTG